MKLFKKLLALALMIATLMTTFVFVAPAKVSAAYDNNLTFTISGTNKSPTYTTKKEVYLYTNTSSSTKTIYCNDASDGYNFRDSKLMIFDANGRIIECGGNLTSATSPITGAPQLYLYIPAGGFMIAFSGSNTNFMKIYDVVMEGAMLYNSTMSVIYEAYASYSGSTLTVKYNNPKAPSANAKKFLFIGNSTTYFNGGPIKFKAMAAAAGIEVDVTYCTRGSAYLSYFVDESYDGSAGAPGDHNKALKAAFAAKKYDYVVLQDAAKATYYTSHDAVEKLIAMAKANGATPVLYMRYSADTTLAGVIANGEKHHYNYATLAKEFNLDVARVTDAFIYSREKYPEINLYASDGGHHSKEGSYLMAATWLYEYLGVDPVGNSYTAQMSTTTAKKLQECAKRACEEEYVWPVSQTSYTASNGTSYKNIAAGKNYVPTGSKYGDYRWTDSFSDYSIRGKLTDGKVSTKGDDTNIATYGASSGHTLTIDLGGISDIKSIKTDLFGVAWGISNPSGATISVSISNAGNNFTEVGNLEMSSESAPGGDWKKRNFSKEFPEMLQARYVRLSYSGTNYAWSSEIEVFGIQGNTQAPDAPDVAPDGSITYKKPYVAQGIYVDENGSTPYPDEGNATLTDGKQPASNAEFNDPAYVGFNKQSEFYQANGYALVTVDLGEYYSFDKFSAFVASDYHAVSGIYAPWQIAIFVSTDGVKWREAGIANLENSTTVPTIEATLIPEEPIGGRYIQYFFIGHEKYNWIMVSEVAAYGEKSEVLPEPPVDEPSDDPSNEPSVPSETPSEDPSDDPSDDPSQPEPPIDEPINPEPPIDEPDVMIGDINESGDIDSMDYVLLKRTYFGTYTLNDITVGDIDENGEIGSMDYVYLRRAYFGTYIIK